MNVVRRSLLRVALGSAVMFMAGGCRVGYDELAQLARGAGASSSSGASGGAGSDAGAGGSANGSGAGEAGEPGVGGTSGADGGTTSAGGTAGSVANAGSSTGGTGANGGDSGAAGDATGGMGATGGAGGSGGASGSSGSSASGGVSGAAGAGASAGGTSGAGGVNAGAGGTGSVTGAGAGGSSGAAGGGGYAGATSLGDCVTLTFNAHDYTFCDVLASWTGARDSCATIGMQLARIDSDAENVWLFDNLYDSPPQTGMWIGATDAAVEGEWRWVDGELFWLGDENGSAQNGLYDAWFFLTQPSAQSSVRDCAVLDQGSIGWYDSDCTLTKVFVCESL